jgi:hypothetical protein
MSSGAYCGGVDAGPVLLRPGGLVCGTSLPGRCGGDGEAECAGGAVRSATRYDDAPTPDAADKSAAPGVRVSGESLVPLGSGCTPRGARRIPLSSSHIARPADAVAPGLGASAAASHLAAGSPWFRTPGELSSNGVPFEDHVCSLAGRSAADVCYKDTPAEGRGQGFRGSTQVVVRQANRGITESVARRPIRGRCASRGTVWSWGFVTSSIHIL